MVQEIHASHPALRAACDTGIRSHLAPLQQEIAAAMASRGVSGFTPGSLAHHVMAVIQGAFVLAEAEGDPAAAVDDLRHLRRYVEGLLAAPLREGSQA